MTNWVNANSHTNINYYCESKNCPKIELILSGNKSCKKKGQKKSAIGQNYSIIKIITLEERLLFLLLI